MEVPENGYPRRGPVVRIPRATADAWDVARLRLLFVVTLAFAALAAPAGAGKATPSAQPALDAQVLAQVNALRARHGLRPLRLSTRLDAAASLHSRQMAERGFFAHESANGGAYWRRIERFYGSKGFGSWTVGENLAWASPSLDARETVRLWMQSPPHRATLLNPAWREIGVAAVRSSAAPGVFKGLEVTVVTADFGARAA